MGSPDGATTVDELLAELDRLRLENARLLERLDALCQGADLWISLYERQLSRANALAAECARLRGDRTLRVSHYLIPRPVRPLRMLLAVPPKRRARAR
jgi:hypothetical protein